MAAYTLPPKEYLWEIFDYDPESGALTWRHQAAENFKTPWAYRAHLLRVGKQVGCANSYGHIQVIVQGKLRMTHRVIYKMMTGSEPENIIDHINGHPSDNRWANLRPATRKQNSQNAKAKRTNKTGIKGIYARVTPAGRRFYIATLDGKHIGVFDTPEAAKAARDEAARKQHGEFFKS